MESLLEFLDSGLASLTLTLLVLGAGGVSFLVKRHNKIITKENIKTIGVAFRETIDGLSSDRIEIRMSSAILLRRFFDKESEYGVGDTPFANMAVNVILALLKTKQTTNFQKALSDGLKFAPGLSLRNADCQRANLAKAYLDDVNMSGADFYEAILSGTLLKNAILKKSKFYGATLNGTKLNGAKLVGADFNLAVLDKVDFRDADLTDAKFDNAQIREVDFTGATLTGATFNKASGYANINIPDSFKGTESIDNSSSSVFISRPGVLDTRQRLFVDNVRDVIMKLGFKPIELNRDEYDASNVLTNVCRKIDKCASVIVFGFKSIHVIDGVFRYSTDDTRVLKQEFFSTPWNHIEIGMSIMKRMPILLLVDDGISDGAFDASINDELLSKLSISNCLNDKNKNVETWLKATMCSSNQ